MKKNIKIGAMSLLLVLLPGSLGVGTVYSSSGVSNNVNEENTTYQENNAVGVDKSTIVNNSENTKSFSSISEYFFVSPISLA